MPYLAHEKQYGVVSPLLWQTSAPAAPVYSNTFLRNFWQVEYRGEVQTQRNQLLKAHVWDLVELAEFLLGWPLIICILLFARSIFRDPAAKGALLLGCCFYAGAAFDGRLYPHYAAPAIALAYIVAACALRAAGRYVAWGVAVLFVLTTSLGLLTPDNRYLFGRIDYHAQAKHASITSRLASEPGRHLVLVEYGPRHDPWEELVYNAADIDGSKIVWARSLGPAEDERLVRQYRDRNLWLVIENGNLKLSRYSTDQQGASLRYSPELTPSIPK